ncbi:MAG: Rpn family recombination-promoting nuclease/putative transposase [Leptospiraceae bacterium]|nr:Rpn family recombination-promoting nuclease/putative transposase [Leptospiraceae bacterium]
MSVNNPHHKFIKDVLSERTQAVASLQAIVPVEIAGLLGWQTLQAEPDSFVDEELRELFADETQQKTVVFTSSGYEICVGWSPGTGIMISPCNVVNLERHGRRAQTPPLDFPDGNHCGGLFFAYFLWAQRNEGQPASFHSYL